MSSTETAIIVERWRDGKINKQGYRMPSLDPNGICGDVLIEMREGQVTAIEVRHKIIPLAITDWTVDDEA